MFLYLYLHSKFASDERNCGTRAESDIRSRTYCSKISNKSAVSEVLVRRLPGSLGPPRGFQSSTGLVLAIWTTRENVLAEVTVRPRRSTIIENRSILHSSSYLFDYIVFCEILLQELPNCSISEDAVRAIVGIVSDNNVKSS